MNMKNVNIFLSVIKKKNSPFLAQTVLLSLLAVLTMVDWPMLPIFTISKDIIPF